ncbi:MAG: hypothetical protein GY832_24465 [Chloroflexi bacterium]|nr:hypothetical protein [Chloroflexota bacterium]
MLEAVWSFSGVWLIYPHFDGALPTASGVVITDSVPSQLGNLGYQTSTDNGVVITCTSDITYAWTVSDLAVGQGGIITISGQVSNTLNVHNIILDFGQIINKVSA